MEFTIPYTAYSRRLPRKAFDANGNDISTPNDAYNFRAETDGSIQVTVSDMTTDTFEPQKSDIIIFPNPCSTNMTIQLPP